MNTYKFKNIKGSIDLTGIKNIDGIKESAFDSSLLAYDFSILFSFITEETITVKFGSSDKWNHDEINSNMINELDSLSLFWGKVKKREEKERIKKQSKMQDQQFTKEEICLFYQWFGCVQDLAHTDFLEKNDFILAEKLYKKIGMRVPESIKEGINKNETA